MWSIVEMRQNDVADLHLLGQGQPGPDGAGIQKACVIDQEGAGSALHGPAVGIEELIGTMTAQHADFITRSLNPFVQTKPEGCAFSRRTTHAPVKKQHLGIFLYGSSQSPCLAS